MTIFIHDNWDNYYLSNFSYANVEYDGEIWKTAEHAYQAAKTTDLLEKFKFLQLKTPKEAKILGRTINLRPDWEEVKLQIMEDIVRAKFTQNIHLSDKIIATGSDEIVEDNTWHDNFYGNCDCTVCQHTPGQNQLGKILMKIRQELRATT